jgi:hypothetical protein
MDGERTRINDRKALWRNLKEVKTDTYLQFHEELSYAPQEVKGSLESF